MTTNATSKNVTAAEWVCERGWLDGDEECQFYLFMERLVDTEYIVEIYTQYINIFLLFYVVLVIYATSHYYSIPYHLYDWKTAGMRKKIRNEIMDQKKARRAKRNLKRLEKKSLLRKRNRKNKIQQSVEAIAYAPINDAEEKVTEDDGICNENDRRYSVGNLVIHNMSTLLNEDNKEVYPQFKGVSEELIQDDNKAFAISYSAYVLALFIILSGGRIPNDPNTDDEIQVMIDTFIWGFVGVA